MNFVLVGLYCSPLLTLIPTLTRTYAKNHVSGNRVSDFRVSGGPPVKELLIFNRSVIKGYKILSKMIRYWIQISTFVVIQFNLMKTILMIMKHPGKIKSAVTQGHHHMSEP